MARFGQGFLNALTQPSYGQGLFELGGAIGGAPAEAARIKAEKERTQLLTKAISSGDYNAMSGIAQMYAGDNPELATTLATKARELALEEQAKQQFENRKSALAVAAEKAGLKTIASSIRSASTPEELAPIAKDFRMQQIKMLPTQTPAVRRSLANNAGITAEEFKDLDLANASDETFNSYIDGQKGKTKAWQNNQGKIAVYRENDYGRVYDESQGKWVDPGQLGLTQAPPQVQKIEQAYQGLKDELVKEGVKGYSELKVQATDAQNILDNISQVRPLLEKGTFGFGAEQILFLKRVGVAIGLPFEEDVVSTEQYVAQAAPRIAVRIKDFGAGTGLSDADLTFSAQAEAGKIPMNAESMRRLLEIAEKAALKKVELYEETTASLRNVLGEEGDAILALYGRPSSSVAGRTNQETPPPPPGFLIDN